MSYLLYFVMIVGGLSAWILGQEALAGAIFFVAVVIAVIQVIRSYRK